MRRCLYVRRAFVTFIIPMLATACRTAGTPPATLKVVGGDEAVAQQFPASVHIPGCSAVRVGPSHILTAAHCVVDDGSKSLRAPYETGATLRIDHGVRLSDAASYDLEVVKTFVHQTYLDVLGLPGSPDEHGEESVDLALVVVKSLPDAVATASITEKSLVAGDDAVIFTGYGCEALPEHLQPQGGPGGLDSNSSVVVSEDSGQSSTLSGLRLKFAVAPFVGYAGTSGTLINRRNQFGETTFSGCPGDSGSAVYGLDADDTVTAISKTAHLSLVGINAFVGPLRSSFMRLDSASPHGVAACLKRMIANSSSDETGTSFAMCSTPN